VGTVVGIVAAAGERECVFEFVTATDGTGIEYARRVFIAGSSRGIA
jgi:hypothetical protein